MHKLIRYRKNVVKTHHGDGADGDDALGARLPDALVVRQVPNPGWLWRGRTVLCVETIRTSPERMRGLPLLARPTPRISQSARLPDAAVLVPDDELGLVGVHYHRVDRHVLPRLVRLVVVRGAPAVAAFFCVVHRGERGDDAEVRSTRLYELRCGNPPAGVGVGAGAAGGRRRVRRGGVVVAPLAARRAQVPQLDGAILRA